MNFGDLIAKGSAVFLKKKLSAMQAVFDAGTAPEKAAFQASVSGVRYLAVNCPRLLAPSGLFTSVSGAFSLGTALAYVPNGVTPSGGNCWVYLPAGAGGLVGGWYEAVLSSTTVGQLVGSPITVASAWIQSTSIISTATVTIPGGAIGTSGELLCDFSTRSNNSAGTKIVRAGVGSSNSNAIYKQTITVPGMRCLMQVVARSANAQILALDEGQIGFGSAGAITSLNTAADWAVNITMQITSPTDWMMLECVTSKIYKGV